MKTSITFLFFMITTIGLSQSSEKWKQYLKKENDRKFEKYYFTSLENAHHHKYEVVKKLDSTFCIILNENLPSHKPLEKVLAVNNLWKLPSNFSYHK